MTINISAIYRYPVKGLSPEPLRSVALMPGQCLPQDRRFAIALPATRFDAERGELEIERDGRKLLRARLSEPEGRQQAGEFFTAFLEGAVEGPLRLVKAPGHAFADARRKPNATTDQYVSLINLASIAALKAAIGAPVDPLRFRANVYFEGTPAWSELDWIEREIALGGTRLRVIAAITRCAATQVNPTTAERDLDIVAALRRGFDHNLMGVYAEVIECGEISVGDALTLRQT
jgi:uncharacterized protein YcbX